MFRLPLSRSDVTPFPQIFSFPCSNPHSAHNPQREYGLNTQRFTPPWLAHLVDFIPDAGTNVVYRHWDTNRCLLYVGRSRAFIRRQSEHRRSAPWWRQIASITVETCESELVTRAAEALAIATEHPVYNSDWQRS